MSLGHKSFIDHYIVSDNLCNGVISVDIMHCASNLSDHSPICLNILLNNLLLSTSGDTPYNSNSVFQRLRWDKSDLILYYNRTRVYLEPWFNALLYYTDIFYSSGIKIDNCILNSIYNGIIDALSIAAECIHRVPVNFFKFWWDAELDEAKDKSMQSHKLWVEAGKPKDGPLFRIMKTAKFNYKRLIKFKSANINNTFSDDLSEALSSKDLPSFWKIWNSKFRKRSQQTSSVDGCTNNTDIANQFMNFFKNVCQPNNSAVHDVHEAEFYKAFKCNNFCERIQLDFELTEIALSKLKCGKAAGIDGITTEHLLYAHPMLVSCLHKLFNLLISNGYVPDSFSTGVMIPLLKSNDLDRTKCDNYRGLTLSPVISKVFEHVLLTKLDSYLQSSDLQFGFKPGIGCSDAIFTLANIVKYFSDRRTTITLAALDVSKAFDRVSHFGLFLKLIDKGVPGWFIASLLNWYSKCTAVVRWGNTISTPFSIESGVRQGGVLSPILFAIYIDEIILSLTNAKLGCTINGVYLGCLLYADDIILLSCSNFCMQGMLNICSAVLNKIDLKFNVNKCVLIRIGPRWKHVCCNLTLDGQCICFASEMKYLGIVLKSGPKFSCNLDNVKVKFYKTFNALYSKSKYADSELVSVHLFKVYCLPLVLYSLEALFPDSNMFNVLNKLINKAVGKIFKTFNSDIIEAVRIECNIPNVIMIYESRRCRFIKRYMFKSNDINKVMSICNGNNF